MDDSAAKKCSPTTRRCSKQRGVDSACRLTFTPQGRLSPRKAFGEKTVTLSHRGNGCGVARFRVWRF